MKGTPISTAFKKDDKAVANANVSAMFIGADGSKVDFKGNTNAVGKFEVCLPLGSLQNLEATDPVTKAQVKKRDKLDIFAPKKGAKGKILKQEAEISTGGT